MSQNFILTPTWVDILLEVDIRAEQLTAPEVIVTLSEPPEDIVGEDVFHTAADGPAVQSIAVAPTGVCIFTLVATQS